jgi:di/tricarboxylate transporter
VWIRPLVLGVVALLDLAVIALLGIQFASKQELQLSLIVPTVVFNLFGAFIYNTARNQD